MMLVAAAAMTFVSCQKQEVDAPKTFSTTLTVNAEVATKTYLEDKTILWGTGETVKLYLAASEGDPIFTDSKSNDAISGQTTASFEFALENIANGPYTIGGIYPASAVASDNKNAVAYKVILPATQNAEPSKYDPSAFIMVLKPETMDQLPETHMASFRRAVALNKITLTGVTEAISSVTISVPNGKELHGRRYFDLTTGNSGDVYYGTDRNKITVNSEYTPAGETNSFDVWFTSWEVELSENEELTIQMTSATGTYTRTIAARANGIKFLEGDLNTLAVNMASAEYVENIVDDTDYSGEWLITAVKNDKMFAALAYESGNNCKALEITKTGDFINEVDGISSCKMTISEKIADGDYAGLYTITDCNGKYLSATGTSSSKNKFVGLEEPAATSYWEISLNDDGTYRIEAVKSIYGKYLSYYGTSSSSLFNCYENTNNTPVVLYDYSMIKKDTTPKITVESNAIEVAADAQTASFTYTVNSYVTGPISVAVSEENKTISGVAAVLGENNTVNVTFDANNDATEKSATIVLSYDGAESVTVTITQAAKPAADAVYYVKVTSAPSDWSGQYILVYANGDSAEILTSEYSSSFFKVKNISLGDGGVLASDITEDCILTISKVTGGYNLRIGSSYISYGGSSTNLNSSTAVPTENNGIWTINLTSQGNATITNVGTTTRFLKYNTAASANRFAAYTSSTGKAVQLYKLQSN